MKISDLLGLIQTYAKDNKRCCMYISFNNNLNFRETLKAAPYLTEDQAILDSEYVLSFDSKAEMYMYFDKTVGDDGPTGSNHYDGKARVYAVTINDKGDLETENT